MSASTNHYISMPLELRGRQDKDAVRNLRRSPDINTMYRVTDPDKTVWCFKSKKKYLNFQRHRCELLVKGSHYLSGREILNLNYSNEEL